MSFKNKVCPVCGDPFKNHVVTLHGRDSWPKCILEAMDMEKEDLKTILEAKQE